MDVRKNEVRKKKFTDIERGGESTKEIWVEEYGGKIVFLHRPLSLFKLSTQKIMRNDRVISNILTNDHWL